LRKLFIGLVFAILLIALAGCGEKSKKDVVDSLDAKVEQMSGYKANAKMTLSTGKGTQEYSVEIWHNKPSYYRVNLQNATKDQNQMILRNDEGVYVLTPALNKSFRFQSDWPQNSSQAYLYESLVQDIKKDKNAEFKSTKDNYVFTTKTNYQNSAVLPKQTITISKKDLTPKSVKIMDTDANVLVKVTFSKVVMDAKFDKGAFDTKRNMTGAKMEVPTMAQQSKKPLEVKYPLQTSGATLLNEKKLKTDKGDRVILSYGGKKKFTIIQERAEVAQVSASTFVAGVPVDLGFAVGALTDHSLSWSYEGVDYMIASKDLSKDELQDVARSVQGQMVK